MKKLNSKFIHVAANLLVLAGAMILLLSTAFIIPGYKINGKIIAPDGTKIHLSYEYKGKITVDSSQVINNKILLKGVLPEAVLCTLSNSVNAQIKIIVLQNESVDLQGTVSKFYYTELKGGSEDKLFSQFKAQSIAITGEYRKELKLSGADVHDKTSGPYLSFRSKIDSLTLAFVKGHPSATASSLAIINSHLNSTDFLKAENCYRFLSEKGKGSVYADRVRSFVDASKAIAIGKQAPNVVLKDLKGNVFDLSTYRGRYVLLDFWASWCAPCREEHPLLKKLNMSYGRDKIDFVSISMDTNEKNWRKAIIDDGLTWTQLHDPLAMSGPLAEAYSLKALPFNCILDPDGKIIATKLRGDALTAFLEQLFSNK